MTLTNMSSKVVLVFVGLWFLLSISSVDRVFGLQPLSKEEDVELEKTLILFTKTAITTIKTKYGEEYNCVDFYKQPAFDHPALKNHKIRPSNNSSSFQDPRVTRIWENGKGCPIGTIPIKKYTKDDMRRAKRIAQIHAFHLNLTRTISTTTGVENSHYHHTVVRKEEASPKYGGIAMHTTLWNPKVQDTQFSSSQMKILSGGEVLQTGWTVNPPLYKDHRTRLFIYAKTKDTSCFNDLCPGFVRDSSSVPLDYVFETICKIGGPLFDWSFLITKDNNNGNWIVKFGANENNITIGFWPKSLFSKSGLSNLGNVVEWGGEIYNPPGSGDLAQMGSGYPEFLQDTYYTADSRLLQVQNEDGELVNAPEGGQQIQSYPYRAKDEGNQGGIFQRLLLFGGPITK